MLFKDLSKCFSNDDDINVINVLCHDCVNSYLAVSNNQFRKALVHDLKFKKTASHKVEIAKVKTTSDKETEPKKQKRMANICNIC